MKGAEALQLLADDDWQRQLDNDEEYWAWCQERDNESLQEKGMDMNRYAATESNDLKAVDFKGKRLKVTISDVQERHYEARNDKPATDNAVLSFQGKEKGLVLNKTNTRVLINAYGPDSAKWIGQEIGLATQETELGEGWVVQPLNVEPPEFDDNIPF